MATNMIRKVKVDISLSLTHIYGVNKIAMEQGIFDIKLMNMPVFGDRIAMNGTNGGTFDNMAKCVIKLKT